MRLSPSGLSMKKEMVVEETRSVYTEQGAAGFVVAVKQLEAAGKLPIVLVSDLEGDGTLPTGFHLRKS